ncbi:hypothetical protein AUK40_01555 [Candidatus Wirthbacteria bacterium CG2_30_54_11]|uniref:Uncharacterized protein n=1 Tax=Candidatus Wirthbacteria bacterium CG2_30_54_11 TaxID=1817892 RepID=A0A1J5J1M1_9BACT|nr:MAG: hypothetical protein AUK40_01555 [Candidatus Wirthbacteria bacterium CG2_30_54_11]
MVNWARVDMEAAHEERGQHFLDDRKVEEHVANIESMLRSLEHEPSRLPGLAAELLSQIIAQEDEFGPREGYIEIKEKLRALCIPG